MMNHPILRAAIALIVVAAVASLSCLATGRWIAPRLAAGHGGSHADASHQRIHRELGLSAEQDRALDEAESRFARRRQELDAEIRQANHELAQALLADREYSPRMTAAVERIHRAQGDLQKLTLEHVFEMGRALRPEQRERLLRLTARALDPTATADASPSPTP